MSEVRPIDANALLEEMQHPLKYEKSESDTDIDVYMRIVENAPTLDYEPVVRCKDCEHHYYSGAGVMFCRKVYSLRVTENHFCSYGAKMDEEQK